MTDKPLIDLVLDLADADEDLPASAKFLVLAALEGDDELENFLNSGSPAPVAPLRTPAPPEQPKPVGAYLSSIEVAGFRGIGDKTSLSLQPLPGLTVVAGRNGSGKSSFAEALELALTGDSYRWKEKPAIWSSAWRNIHQTSLCALRIGLAVEGVGATTVGLDWTDNAQLDERKTWTQRSGERREPGTVGLGWDAALDLYRPILSYEELSGLIQGGPSQLHDALDKILDLDQITDAAKRLTEQLAASKKPDDDAAKLKRGLKAALTDSDDERAAVALTQLGKHNPDLDGLVRLATGTGEQTRGVVSRLRALTRTTIPAREAVEQTAAQLRQAVAAVATNSDLSLNLAERRTALLKRAVELHDQHGDMECPVCGEGRLSASWHERVTTELARDHAHLNELRASREQLEQARRHARALLSQAPQLTELDGVNLATLPSVIAAVQRWYQAPEDDIELAGHLTQSYSELAEAFAVLHAEAAAVVAEREDTWAPIAQQLGEWVRLKQQVLAQTEAVQSLKQASTWVKENATTLRNQRLEPFVTRTQQIWVALRQESNVDLGAITLEGQGTKRHVELSAMVDGEPAGAFSVMSQGELHALALALFLPRATAPASPFRFVVLDDPIQAMDPAKVDGFVQVLAEIAQDRQVVVFSHDDRLAETVRRMAVPGARILEVTRGANSVVRIQTSLDPARRYVEDAEALARDRNVPTEVLAKALPGICRMAVEAAARDYFYARRFAVGTDRAATERDWHRAERTTSKVALALEDDAGRDISPWSERQAWRKSALRICGRGVHEGITTDPINAARNVRKTVEDLLAGRS